jgi:hypothetical protein
MTQSSDADATIRDVPARRGVLGCVRQQVRQHLDDAIEGGVYRRATRGHHQIRACDSVEISNGRAMSMARSTRLAAAQIACGAASHLSLPEARDVERSSTSRAMLRHLTGQDFTFTRRTLLDRETSHVEQPNNAGVHSGLRKSCPSAARKASFVRLASSAYLTSGVGATELLRTRSRGAALEQRCRAGDATIAIFAFSATWA